MQVVTDKSHSNDFRQFLDKEQYSTNGILRYERIFGEGFVSTGGAETTKASPPPPPRQKIPLKSLQSRKLVQEYVCGCQSNSV